MTVFAYSPNWGQCGVDHECPNVTGDDLAWLLNSQWLTVIVVVLVFIWFGRERGK